ncbi:hypothetical protein OG373_06765 [Streptomyces avidinii]|uniref:hypothetical protein n=1 Tax=Streptomyces avidinii TaxID=1895 RepID=UPI003863284A|nr:hypothetical protein OG373_06765 [Streptomyces avidinii]
MTAVDDVVVYLTLALESASTRPTPEATLFLTGQAAIDLAEDAPVDAITTLGAIALQLLVEVANLRQRTPQDLWQERALALAEHDEISPHQEEA